MWEQYPKVVFGQDRNVVFWAVIQAVVEDSLKPGRASVRLGLTVRQVERLVIRYEAGGPAAIASRARGRPGNRKLDDGIACRALALIREYYSDFGPTLASEKVRERHGLDLSKETVRHLMTEAGFWYRANSATQGASTTRPPGVPG